MEVITFILSEEMTMKSLSLNLQNKLNHGERGSSYKEKEKPIILLKVNRKAQIFVHMTQKGHCMEIWNIICLAGVVVVNVVPCVCAGLANASRPVPPQYLHRLGENASLRF